MTNIGFIGTGNMGRHQASAFAAIKGVRIHSGADMSPASRELFAKTYPDAKVFDNHQEMLADKKLDGVVVVIPTAYHQSVVNDALKAKVPVLCEKPLGRTVAQCNKMIEASKKTGIFLMVAHCRRFDTHWGQMAKIVASNKLGRPLLWRSVTAGMGPRVPWYYDDKIGGGPMIDGAVHNYDFANLMLGKPLSVVATAIDLTGTTAVNSANAVIEYEKGDQLMLSWSWGVPGTTCGGMDILGSKGTMADGPGKIDVSSYVDNKYGFLSVTSRATEKTTLHKFVKTNMYVTQAKHFINCFKGKAKCISTAQEATKAVATAEAVFKSIRNHGKRTKVDL